MRAGLLLFVVACASTPEPEPAPATPTTGTWSRELAGGESERLHLFAGGIFGYQHVGPKLPIARAYGWWSRDAAGAVQLTVVGVEPDSANVSPAFDRGWTFVSAATMTSERDWTYLVARAQRH